MAGHQALQSLGFSRQEHWSGLPFPSPVHESEMWKWSCSVMPDSSRSHGLQPTRLLHPWDFSGKNTGVRCHVLLQCMKVKSESEVAQSRLTLSDPMDCSLPGFSIHGIFQARVLEWGAIAFSHSPFKTKASYLIAHFLIWRKRLFIDGGFNKYLSCVNPLKRQWKHMPSRTNRMKAKITVTKSWKAG